MTVSLTAARRASGVDVTLTDALLAALAAEIEARRGLIEGRRADAGT